MKPFSFRQTLVAILALAFAAAFTVAAAQPEVKAPADVSVHFLNPHEFTESRNAGFRHEFDHNDYLQKLRAFVVSRAAPMLAPGQHLSITFTNIKLAGGYEPWLGPYWNDVRIMRDIYPPRFELKFKLTGPDGEEIRQGTRTLTDLAYLYDSPSARFSTDPLGFDKALLDRWLRRGPAHW